MKVHVHFDEGGVRFVDLEAENDEEREVFQRSQGEFILCNDGSGKVQLARKVMVGVTGRAEGLVLGCDERLNPPDGSPGSWEIK